MNTTQKKTIGRIRDAFLGGLRKAGSTIWFLLKIMVPTSLVVAVLGWSGVLQIISGYLSPLMRLIGLPGQAALVFISGALLNNYSAIAVMGTVALSLRDATILAVMCLICHNLLVETTVMKSAGSSAIKMVFLRLTMALVAAFLLNLILPQSMAAVVYARGVPAGQVGFWPMLGTWGLSTLKLVGTVILYVVAIMLVQSFFEEFGVMRYLSKFLAPFMKVLGLPPNVSFLWVVINIVGYAYGAGIIKSEYESGKLKKEDGDLFNHHAAICHSLMEDSILYSALGIAVGWLIIPRFLLAIAVVWGERLRRRIF
ncbi:MAG: transporter, partial [Spirochaetaceae bacterium]|nr:transporter [Spirochaetaceae bacterium]